MRKTVLAATTSALAAAAMLTGAGTAVAAEGEPSEDPTCIVIETFNGKRTMCLTPDMVDGTMSLGYGSAGTGSLMDLLTRVINTGSVVLSVDVPNSTGSYAPGSFGSYGPEASIGELFTGSVGSAGGAF